MISKEDILEWKRNGRRFLYLLWELEEQYKCGKMKKKEKKRFERELHALWEKTHWEKNPFIKDNQLLREMAVGLLKDFDAT